MSLLVAREIAEKYNVKYCAVLRWSKEGMFICVKSGVKTYIQEESFAEFLRTGVPQKQKTEDNK